MRTAVFGLILALATFSAFSQDTTIIHVDASKPGKPVSKYLTGSCIEDVNHEIYGGIDSQMIFGESFQEPPRGEPLKGMVAFEGQWKLGDDGALEGEAGQGPKLLREGPAFADGEIGIDVFLPRNSNGNAGLIVRAARPGPGADNFDGYEIALD